MASKTLMSVAEFDALPEREGWKVELSEGELVMTASARTYHNLIREKLGASLMQYAVEQQLGTVLWETEFRLDEALVRIPDLAFLTPSHLASYDHHALAERAPEITVEIVSPSNTAADLALKVRQYLNTGAHFVWVVYPELKQIHIFKPGERPEVREAEAGHILDAPELLPGWNLPLRTLFGSTSVAP